MIRNVVLGRLAPEGDPALLDRALAELQQLTSPGMLALTAGRDLGLREGGYDFAIVGDFADEEAYRAYDADEEHNRIRRELFAKACDPIHRVQFRLGGLPVD